MKNRGVATNGASATTTLRPFALIVLCGTVFLSVINASMSSLALPDIQGDFNVKADDLPWVVTAYLIPFASGTVVYGRLGDMFGTKKLYLGGLAAFAIASAGVSAAPGFWEIVGARVVQGASGTVIPSISMATIVKTTSPAGRGRAIGATVVAVGVGFGLGPLAGGTLTDAFGWRGPFLATGIAVAAFLPMAAVFVPNVPGAPGQRFDFAGVALMCGAVTGTIIALNRLPSNPGSALGLAGAGLGALLWPFVVLRVRSARDPFVAREVAANGRFWGLSAIGAMTQGGHFAVLVLVPLLLTRYHGMTTFKIGMTLLPGAIAIGAFGMAGGALLNRLGTRRLLLSGTGTMLGAAALFHVAAPGWQPWAISLLYIALAGGYGMINASVVSAATGQFAERLAGVATGVYNLVYFMGGAVSVAIAGAILRSRDGTPGAWNPLYGGIAPEFSDAMAIVLVYAVVGVALAVAFATPHGAEAEG